MKTGIRIGITGRPGIGKTTVIRRVISRLRSEEMKVGGMFSSDIRDNFRRVGFEIIDVSSGRKGILAYKEDREGYKVGKYVVNIKDLEGVGVEAIKRAISGDCDLVIIDEIAPMELKSKKFIDAVEEAMNSEKNMLVSIHRRSNHPLVRRIREEFEVIEVTMENRKNLPGKIVEKITG